MTGFLLRKILKNSVKAGSSSVPAVLCLDDPLPLILGASLHWRYLDLGCHESSRENGTHKNPQPGPPDTVQGHVAEKGTFPQTADRSWVCLPDEPASKKKKKKPNKRRKDLRAEVLGEELPLGSSFLLDVKLRVIQAFSLHPALSCFLSKPKCRVVKCCSILPTTLQP